MRRSAVLLVVLVLVLGACSGGSSSPSVAAGSPDASVPAATSAPTTAPSEAAEPIELVVWHQFGTETNSAAFQTVKEGFEAEHPNVTIKASVYDVTGVMTALSAAMPAGTGPDIVNLDSTEAFLGAMVDGGFAYDLSSAYTERGWDAKFAGFKDRVTYNNIPYGVGHSVEVVVLYYNAGLFEQLGLEPPTTWEAIDKANVAAKANGLQAWAQGDLIGYGAVHHCGGIVHAVAPLEVIREAELLSGTKTWREPALIEGAKQCQDWVREGYWPTNVVEISEDDWAAQFFSGKGLMHTTGTWEAKTETDQDIRAVALPSRDPARPLQAAGGLGDTWMINAATEHAEAAIDFLDYMNFSQTSNNAYYEAGYLPTNADFQYNGTQKQTAAFAAVPGIISQLSAASADGGGLGHWIGYEGAQSVIDVFNPTWQQLLALKITPEELGETMATAMEEARAAR